MFTPAARRGAVPAERKHLALLIVRQRMSVYQGVLMKHYVLMVVILTLLLGLPVGVFAQGDSANVEKEVRDALEKYRTALTQHDAAALKQIWADDYTFINGAGEILTKDQRLANLGSGATSLDTITLGEDVKVRVYGNDAAVSTSRVTLKGKYSGKAVSGDYQSMTVWVKGQGGWQLVANQVTPITGKP
jgi:ketosteroid isomerase-like protein